MLAFHRFTAADLESAAKVYVSCFNAPPWNDDWSLKASTKRLETLLRFPGAIGLVATGSGKIVAWQLATVSRGQTEALLSERAVYRT